MTQVYYYLKRTQAQAKEQEYEVPEDLRAKKDIVVEKLFPLVISLLGNISRKIINDEKIDDNKKIKQLEVISKYLVSYYRCGGSPEYNDYLLLLSAAAYYFLGQYGTANILSSKLNYGRLGEHGNYAVLLAKILNNNNNYDIEINEYWAHELREYLEMYILSLRTESSIKQDYTTKLRKKVLNYGNDRDIIFADVFLAVTKIKAENSCFKIMKKYADLSDESIALMVDSGTMVSEMWPAQKLMAEKGFFDGKSGIVQLPTGAGKTKSIALCIYSFKEKKSSSISVIVTPFRALAREVRRDIKRALSFDEQILISEISDLMQEDYNYDLFNQQTEHKVLVLTPEKLLYIIEREPDFVQDIGQIIFDEGHLFEDESRGTKFELLISNILANTPKETQKILISAMIGGVDTLNEWITNAEGSIVTEEQFYPAEKNIVSLRRSRQGVKSYYDFVYLNSKDVDRPDFYVPRIISGKILNNGDFFPNSGIDFSIATMLRLIRKDNCAIFCGTKPNVNTVLKKFCMLSDQGIELEEYTSRNDKNEQDKICNLIEKNYGEDDLLKRAAQLGIFAHHGALSDGVKSSIEFALQKSLISNVICTSTLAQGVNMPIKYLIISNTYQGGKPMQSRDFLNLIGRVGRPGMYVDGTIIYSNPKSYNRKDLQWIFFKSLFDSNKEQCYSTLEIICKRGQLYYEGQEDCFYESIEKLYKNGKTNKREIREYYVALDEKEGEGKTLWADTWDYVNEILGEIEWFLAQYDSQVDIETITKYTLAKHNVREEEGKRINSVFREIKQYLDRTYKNPITKKLFAKSLLPSDKYLQLNNEIREIKFNDELSQDELIMWCLNILRSYEDRNLLRKMDLEVVYAIASCWMRGDNYCEILNYCNENGLRIIKRKKAGNFNLDEVINICSGSFGYSSTILLNAISDYLRQDEETEEWAEKVDLISSRLKYGLYDREEILVYELGFNDRNISKEICEKLGIQFSSKSEARKVISANKEKLNEMLSQYPSYYMELLNNV